MVATALLWWMQSADKSNGRLFLVLTFVLVPVLVAASACICMVVGTGCWAVVTVVNAADFAEFQSTRMTENEHVDKIPRMHVSVFVWWASESRVVKLEHLIK